MWSIPGSSGFDIPFVSGTRGRQASACPNFFRERCAAGAFLAPDDLTEYRPLGYNSRSHQAAFAPGAVLDMSAEEAFLRLNTSIQRSAFIADSAAGAIQGQRKPGLSPAHRAQLHNFSQLIEKK